MSDITFPESPISNVMLGMDVLATAMNISDKRSAEIASFTLTGKFDKELLSFIYWREHGKAPENEAQFQQPKYLEILERMKAFVRFQIQGILDEASHLDRQQQAEAFKQMVADMRDSSKPHPMGTVAQLAQRLNVSKSEIRRRRTDGTLNQFLQEKLGNDGNSTKESGD